MKNRLRFAGCAFVLLLSASLNRANVPYADSAPLPAKLPKNGTLKTCKGFPHGMPTTEADMINADLLAFIKA